MSWGLIRVQEQLAIVFSYVDPQAGPSAKGSLLTSTEATVEDARAAATRPNVTVRLGEGLSLRPLPELEVARLALPAEPEWLRFFQAPPSGAWTKDPFFKGRFHPQFANDVQGVFFFPSLRKAEQMWVRLERETPVAGTYEGVLLNTAHLEPALKEGSRVQLRGAEGASGPVWVSEVTAQNLAMWDARCEACGFDLVLEPVEVLIDRAFPDAPADAELEALTTRCAMCRQTQVVRRKVTGVVAGPSRATKLALVLVPAVLGLAALVALLISE